MTPSEPQRILRAIEDPCGDPRCVTLREELRDELARVREELENAHKEVGKARTETRRVKGERNRRWEASSFAGDGEECFARWNKVMREDKAREFSNDRANNTIARLEAGHTVADIFKAIEGARALSKGECDWKPKPPFDKLTELAKICESEAALHRYQGYADEAKVAREEATRGARHTFIVYNERVFGHHYDKYDEEHGYYGTCPHCAGSVCRLDAQSTEFRCANGCVPDDILAGLKKWWCELYPDRKARRMALDGIRGAQRLDAQRDVA